MCRALNYFEHFVIFICVLSDFASIYAFTSLVSVPVGIASSAFGLKVCVKTAGIKHKSISTKKTIEDLILSTPILIMMNLF